MNRKISFRLTTAALVATLFLSTAAFARSHGGENCAPGKGQSEQCQPRGMKGMMRLHDDLKLNAKQEALWQEAVKAKQANMGPSGDPRMHMRPQYEEIQAMLNQPGADLRAVAKRMDELKGEQQKQREVTREQWLAVYDTLNTEQKEKVRVFFKDRFEPNERFGKFGKHSARHMN